MTATALNIGCHRRGERRQHRCERSDIDSVRGAQVEDHDRDDHGDHAIAQGFEPAGFG
jgi:hypothetical protein